MKEIITADNAPKAIGPYSAGVKSGGFIYLSGQLGIDPGTGTLVSDSLKDQTFQIMKNIKAVLVSAGTDMDAVVKTTIFLTDMKDFKKVNQIYSEFFTGDFPARSTVSVKELPLKGKVEIEVIARE